MRHHVALEAIDAPEGILALVGVAEATEQTNPYSAAEQYSRAALDLDALHGNGRDVARIFVRAATCYEMADQRHDAAAAYERAAKIYDEYSDSRHTAAELFNRAGIHFLACAEYFSAGNAWRRAGDALSNLTVPLFMPTDYRGAISSGKPRAVAGHCYATGAAAFLKSEGNNWAPAEYWKAGQAYADAGLHVMAFHALRKALLAGVQLHRTHERDEMNEYLLLRGTSEPLKVLEEQLVLSYRGAYSGATPKAQRDADLRLRLEMIETVHEFYLAFTTIGNLREASVYRVMRNERETALLFSRRQYLAWITYWLWGFTSRYGESLPRWSTVCATTIILFAVIYFVFDAIGPASTYFDYVYFSIGTFAAAGYGDIQPIGSLGRALASLEIALGLMMFGVLVSFATIRLQR